MIEVPDEFAPVFADACDYYPQLVEARGERYSPFGYHSWEEGSWACDGRRLHLVGELPARDWANLLREGAFEYTSVAIVSSAELRRSVSRDELAVVPVTHEWLYDDRDELAVVPVTHEGLYDDDDDVPRLPKGAPPEGFRIAGDLLLDALDFLVGDHDNQVSIEFSQGVFKLKRHETHEVDAPALTMRDDDGNEIHWTQIGFVNFGRTCLVAGYLGYQWELPLYEGVFWRGKKTNDLSASIEAAFTDELDARVCTSYPSPLAWSYRLPLAATTATQETLLLLRAGENVLAFLASLSLALVSPPGRQSLGLDLPNLWRGGISPGTWARVLKQCGPVLQRYEDNELARLLGQCLSHEPKTGILHNLDELVAKKNSFKHDRGFGSEDACQAENEAIVQALRVVYERLHFIARYPMRLVYSIDVSERKRCFLLDCHVYKGAMSGPQSERREWYEALPKNRLYVDTSDMAWVSLYPFMQRAYCPQCGDVELFFIEKVQEGAKTHMKSFERGHVVQIDGVTPDLLRLAQRGGV